MAPSEQPTAPALRELLQDAALAGEWFLDGSRSTVSLKNRSIWGLARVNGVFHQVTGTGTVSPTGEVNGALTVGAASFDTKNTKRDKHLRSPDFFNSDNYPDITFTVDGIRPSGHGVTVTGMLRVRNRARPLTFDGTASVLVDGEVSLDAAVHINRNDFGLTWNLLGTVSVNNTITIHAVFARRRPPAPELAPALGAAGA
jgi:polyisoprenoid-binding protein YceI